MHDADSPLSGLLPDGREIRFRVIAPADKPHLQAGLRKLSAQSRYRRFHANIDRLSERQLRYLTELDFENHVAWVAYLPNERIEDGIGVGRWIRTPENPELAEVAVTVLDEFQGMGVGKTLLWLLVRSAIRKGIRAFRVGALADNPPVLRMLEGMGTPPGEWHQGILEAIAPLPADAQGLLEALKPPLPLKAMGASDVLASPAPASDSKPPNRA